MGTSAVRFASARPENDTLDRGLGELRELLPSSWSVNLASEVEDVVDDGDQTDTMIDIRDPQGTDARLIVEVKRTFAPRDVETILGGRLRLLRRLDPTATVVVFASWLSPRTRKLLAERKVGYLDLTGNVWLELERPAVVIRTMGAEQDPDPPRREGVSLRGVVAGRVVRLLADTQPPYTASAIARASGVSVPYVSRLLTTLDREALVRRGHRGIVVDVDWPNLLCRRAETYRLFGTNAAQGYLSGTGAREAVRRLRDSPSLYQAVTGSFAAAQRAPIAAPSQLTLYVADPAATADVLGLLPADQGADVVLLQPYDMVVLDRLDEADGLRVVAPSQLALDCLAGNGRMPAEGEALLEWMSTNEDRWRSPRIEEPAPRPEVFP